jgi:hypothetical protein
MVIPAQGFKSNAKVGAARPVRTSHFSALKALLQTPAGLTLNLPLRDARQQTCSIAMNAAVRNRQWGSNGFTEQAVGRKGL